jgi:hypothetical protein
MQVIGHLRPTVLPPKLVEAGVRYPSRVTHAAQRSEPAAGGYVTNRDLRRPAHDARPRSPTNHRSGQRSSENPGSRNASPTSVSKYGATTPTAGTSERSCAPPIDAHLTHHRVVEPTLQASFDLTPES